MAGQLRAPLLLVETLPEGTVSIRSPLIVLEPLGDSARNLRGNYIVLEPLADMFRQLRCSSICIESLYPIPPEGHVSTELFPGSLGSPTALPGLAFTVHKRPTFSTAIYKGASGTSVRRANMQYPIWEFELSYEFLRDDVHNEYRTLCGFFMSRLGGFDTFLFKDRDDYNVTAGALATTDGVTTQFYFKRVLGGFAEKVGQVDNGSTIHLYLNGVLVSPTLYDIVLPNAVVFHSAPTTGQALTADFQFFFNCRFQDDVADFDKFADKFWELQKIVLETVPQ